MNTLKFDPSSHRAFKRDYARAVAEGKDTFTFQGVSVLVQYAEYVLEYLETKMQPEVHHDDGGVVVVEVWKHPAGLGWFPTFNGLQDVDLGYFPNEKDAQIAAFAMVLAMPIPPLTR